jgi:hypothetical protein
MEHIKVEEGVYHFCDFCPESFPDSMSLSRHRIRNHFHQIRTNQIKRRCPPDNTLLFQVTVRFPRFGDLFEKKLE